MRRVIVLRPEPGASATVERARQRGIDARALPLFAIEPVPWEVRDAAAFDGLLLTSANAVHCAGPGLKRLSALPAYAVGEATADAARTAGMRIVGVGDGGVDALLATIDRRALLLHLCGEDRRAPADTHHRVAPVIVYRATALEPPPDLAGTEGAIVLVHSPRAGQRFGELIEDRATIAIVAISPAAADAAGGGWEAVHVAQTPTDEALLALAVQLCDKAARG
jgi:uroporphyrinogen-III synthase